MSQLGARTHQLPSRLPHLLDLIDGGDGADTLYGQFGDDKIYGGEGMDVIYGDDVPDNDLAMLYGGGSMFGNDKLFGGDGID